MDAQGASLQAVVYNRVGDLGIVLMVFYSVGVYGVWGMSDFYVFCSKEEVSFILFFGLFAASGKSSQFGFHPWLPSAMEGPTPVSALLHRSTMVVAGVFLLVRIVDLVGYNSFFCGVCLLLGGLTSLFASSVALFQYDFKKVVAYSTTSQLGLMFCGLGLGQPFLSFFHICTHAFFKAMLFLCSGRVIHRFGNEQDLRKLGKVMYRVPITFSCLVVGSVALAGFPFLSGFYSKDLILERVVERSLNFVGVVVLFLAAMLTAVYRIRVVFFCSGVKGKVLGLQPVREESFYLIAPVVRLVMGSIFFGWFMASLVFDLDLFFVTLLRKVFPVFFMVVGLTYYLGCLLDKESFLYRGLGSFFIDQWGYSHVVHVWFSSLFYNISLFFSYFVDLRLLSFVPEYLGY